jgi:hypothetical protein
MNLYGNIDNICIGFASEMEKHLKDINENTKLFIIRSKTKNVCITVSIEDIEEARDKT